MDTDTGKNYICEKCNKEFVKKTSWMSHKGWCGNKNIVGGMTNRNHTANIIKQQSLSAIKRYSDPAERELAKVLFAKTMEDYPGFRRLFRQGNKGDRPAELRNRISIGVKKWINENRDIFDEFIKKRVIPGAKISKTLKEFYKENPQVSEEISKRFIALWQDPVFRDKMAKIHSSSEWKNKMKNIILGLRDQITKAIMLGNGKKSINKSESKLDVLLASLFSQNYKFVGHGEVVIAGKCPDFINVNGQKKIIELFGDYWHRNDNPQDRIDIFTPYGYKTLVVWEHELKDIPELTKRLKVFHQSKLFRRTGI